MAAIGYEYVRIRLNLKALPPRRPARITLVTRVESMADHLAVPSGVAPGTEQPLAHLLFALKHEGVNLAILMEAFRQIPADDVVAELRRTPSGGYARLAGYLSAQVQRRSRAVTPRLGLMSTTRN